MKQVFKYIFVSAASFVVGFVLYQASHAEYTSQKVSTNKYASFTQLLRTRVLAKQNIVKIEQIINQLAAQNGLFLKINSLILNDFKYSQKPIEEGHFYEQLYANIDIHAQVHLNLQYQNDFVNIQQKATCEMKINEIELNIEHNLKTGIFQINRFDLNYSLDVFYLDKNDKSQSLEGSLIPDDAIKNAIDTLKENISSIQLPYDKIFPSL